MIKTIIFDNNGVLTTSDAEGAHDKVAEFLNKPIREFKHLWEEEARPLDIGKISNPDFLRNFLKHFGLEERYNELLKIHLQCYQDKPEVKEFAKNLGGKYETALLTNFGNHFDSWNKRWKMEEIFRPDKIFVSAKIGMAKPGQEIYRYVLNVLCRKGEECLFIDDNQDNIAAANSLGIKGILFTDLENLKEELKGYSLEI
ncbi:TPA: hypothetical protein DDW69_03270 [candidate division CPR2 bacterium]|uniref:HAD-superfamily hydrolase, subfamily IA, variant 3 n=1 Tax=candidate division CPR2 bacterium GW2011_GWC1_41_48 TaxID=1618344 RepID=A0A0G0W7Y8_UNCC2|nr:MAG: HAD-superfamily hydrolase, subfamily IA, variant 3 [candidate division CPR2 bacterium GW2011_GWC2_39_35]KKR28374.1 MAG: HAD-superfamily hydrolase, subfamily IA, variant 3 [candidate division CPR2 bacterium GW2011_GWD2_39_7]KKR29136.1 MAG: HAD-superfamily hydrolase, subfamily IA, variant 3 [candidate division CPR2 bacterium GW2011_GWD1_39_7]KKS09090.1 MAG: HAD-superfamily hydrolase, subfamily IA, variant 3 [candidate division CPR2 bacterium GW2011_GWC1_41_48]OGB62150.1 MAG: hypothetical 